MVILYLILFCMYLGIAYLIGRLCQDIVIIKGYDEKKYFWFGFIFGVFGLIIAAASPDLNIHETLVQINRKININDSGKEKIRSKKNEVINKELKTNDNKSNSNTQGNNNINTKVKLIKINEKYYCSNCGSQQSLERSVCSDCGMEFAN
ncbi:MAG: hypothetical protein K9L64_05970 [Candidatus Izimaplasma sp.]|nr:hypothetical protein [Candidatus Izimaplasma bacterium]